MGTVLIVLDSNKAGHKRLLRIAGKTGDFTLSANVAIDRNSIKMLSDE
jgi:hypothetical protein